MSLVGDIIDRVLFPNRELHAIPVLDGAFSPNQRLDHARQLGDEIERPDDLALGPDGALYVSSGAAILRCAGDDFAERTVFASFASPVGGLAWTADGRLLACVSKQGLVALSSAGDVVGKLESAGGEPIACPISVTVAADGTDLRDRRIARQSAGALAGGSDAEPCRLGSVDILRPGLERCARARGQTRLALGRCRLARRRGGLGRRILGASTDGVLARGQSPARDRQELRGLSELASCAAPAGDYWMAFFGVRTQLTEFVLREREFCEAMMKTVPPELWIGPTLDGRFNYREPTQIGRIKKLGIQKPWAPARSYGLVARLNGDGEAIESLHSRVDGRIHGVTAVAPSGRGCLRCQREATAWSDCRVRERRERGLITMQPQNKGDERRCFRS